MNVSTGLASLGWLTDPHNDYHGVNLLGCNSSKAALNAVTVSFAETLAPCGIRVNGAGPGYVAGDFTDHSGFRTVAQGAGTVVKPAASEETRPTAGFFDDAGRLPW